ncbi:hypothetical protein [Streptomyces chilikensis]|uniref:hypothetical protein n=1 Tax=Streptomyces chilikensis TaxID=1194079 RepID=UPI00140DB1E1|nr:hypothetical protein [Streptomyces chilikensis]
MRRDEDWRTPRWLVQVWTVAAVVGIVAGAPVIVRTVGQAYDDHRAPGESARVVDEACAGLVTGEEALRLENGTDRLSAERGLSPGGLCTIHGADEDRHEPLLELRATAVTHTVGTPAFGGGPFGSDPAPDGLPARVATPEPQPLGDGSPGSHTDHEVTVRAVCGPGSGKSAPGVLLVTARSGEAPLSRAGLDRLARVARAAVPGAAAMRKCRTEVPAFPTGLTPVGRALRPLTGADGSCAWLEEHVERSARREAAADALPDRMVEVPVAPRSAAEPCLLAPGAERTGEGLAGLPEDERRKEGGRLRDGRSHWYLRTDSYFGPDAERVRRATWPDGDRPLDPGTSGHDPDTGLLWASSTCDGAPAVHAMTVGRPYGRVLADRLPALFRAYVEDVTERRGCTG